MSENVLSAVRRHLLTEIGGSEPTSASVTLLGVEPLEVLRFGPDESGVVRYVTMGCARHPMGDPGELVADPLRGPRAELVLEIEGGLGPGVAVQTTLAILAATPAVEGLILVPDALIDLSQPLWVGAPFTAVLLGASGVNDLVLEEPKDPVRFLSVTPLTGTEAAWIRLRGADALREAWAEAGIDIRDPQRSAASL